MEKGFVPTRTKAQALILAGRVTVNGKPGRKAGTAVSTQANVEVSSGPRYVSRGGDKLHGAILDLNITVAGKVCLDVGASTGGFTDCLLQEGARRVYAADVGKGQLDFSLRQDPRVVVIEQTHILSLDASFLEERPNLATIDVSFISLKRVLSRVAGLLMPASTVLALVKPQFEVGRKHLRKGVVRSIEMQQKAVADVKEYAAEAGLQVVGEAPSRLKGPKGNQEYFLHMIK